MSETGDHGWRAMGSAPRDGTRVIVTVKPAEQGPAEVDLVYWSRGDRRIPEGWRAADSPSDLPVFYDETELKGWMPMPEPSGGGAFSKESGLPEPWQGDDIPEESGSGI